MSEFSYEAGRLNLPFVGHSTFAKSPVCVDWESIDADVAVLGVPNDMGTQWRSGTRFGPRAIREASTLFSFGHGGAYDHEDDITYLSKEQVRVVQFDAHLDFVDVRHGVRYGHGNPMRRASEMDHVTGLSQLGIRNVSSSNRKDYEDARVAGSDILSVRQIRALGKEAVLERIPAGVDYYVTIDIDGFDVSIAPGTGTPSHGGFLYYEVLEMLQGLSKRGNIVGMDLVEVAPAYDPTGSTAILAAQILMNAIGFIFYERSLKAIEVGALGMVIK